MKKIIDSVTEVAAEKAAESTKAILGGLKPTQQLLVVGLGLIGLSFVSVLREENKKAQKGPRKT